MSSADGRCTLFINNRFSRRVCVTIALACALSWVGTVRAQSVRPVAPGESAVSAPPAATTPDYTIGPDDLLSITFWQEKDMSADVVVRPDGRISMPLLRDIEAAGLTPEQLRINLERAASRFVRDPIASVIVKQINSRKVYITGQVAKPGTYPLTSPTTVLQLIATAGGLSEFAKRDRILVVRTANGQQTSFRVNYKELAQQKGLQANLVLQPGDTVLVP